MEPDLLFLKNLNMSHEGLNPLDGSTPIAPASLFLKVIQSQSQKI
jgi:hypothetical protein